MRHITIDAKGKSPGRIATEVVRILRGKDDAGWEPNRLPDVSVTVTRAAHMSVPPRRLRTKVYRRHSQWPAGLKEEPLARIWPKRPEEVLRRAVFGMLPKNRLRAQALKRLRVYANEQPNNETLNPKP